MSFLYGFKAAPRGRSRRRLGALACAPAGAPATAAPTPVGWRGAVSLVRGRCPEGHRWAAADL